METKTVKLTLEQAKELYNQGGNFKTIALGAYSEKELTEPNLPNSWEEFCERSQIKECESWIKENSEIESVDSLTSFYPGYKDPETDKNLLPNKKIAEAMLALCQLIQLRDCYNQGWKPGLDDTSSKYCIVVIKGKLCLTSNIDIQCVMTFKTMRLREKFFYNFKDLLEQAKELL